MNVMRTRQISQEEKLDYLHKSMISVNLVVQGSEAMYKSALEAIEDLKSNSTEVWRRLMKVESRLDKLELDLDRVDTTVTDHQYGTGVI